MIISNERGPSWGREKRAQVKPINISHNKRDVEQYLKVITTPYKTNSAKKGPSPKSTSQKYKRSHSAIIMPQVLPHQKSFQSRPTPPPPKGL